MACPIPTAAAGQPPCRGAGGSPLALAPGQDGSPDGTAAAAEVAAFFGTAQASDFANVETPDGRRWPDFIRAEPKPGGL